jgi:hypothetical protein
MRVPPVLVALRKRSSGARATTCETVQTLRDLLHVHLVSALDRWAARGDVRGVPRCAASASAGRARSGSAYGFRVEPHELRVLLVLVEDIVDQLAVGVSHHVIALATLAQVHVEPVVDIAVA